MTKLYLDLAAQAGVFVIFDCQIDNIAKAGFTGTNDQAWKDLLANLTLVKDHPALAGYYACDDCCHVKVNVDEHEYRGIEQIHAALREWDPYHLFIGSSACPDVWMWQEGLEFNAGAPAGSPSVSDVGLDVVMREAYGGGGPGDSGLSPASKGVIRARQTRYYPMTFAASWEMPAPDGYVTAGAFRASMYGDAIHQSKYSMNNFAFDDSSASDRLIDEAFFGYALESAELRNSWLSLPLGHGEGTGPTAELVSVETDPPCTTEPECVTSGVKCSRMRPTTLLKINCGSYGRLWIEHSNASSSGVGFCAHAVVINPQARFVGITLTLSGLPPEATTAQRLFDQIYTVNVSAAGVLTDGLPGQSAAVYRFGCDIAPLPMDSASVVYNGDYEDLDLSNPSKFCTRGCKQPVGRSIYTGVGSTVGWRLMHGTPDLPAVFDVQQDDFRASFRPDTADPYHGRHSLRLHLPATSPAILPIPLQAAVYGSANGASTTWRLELRVRSSPAGALVSLNGGGCYSAPWAIPGDPHRDAQCSAGSRSPEVLGRASSALSVAWTALSFEFKNETIHSQNLWLNISTERVAGATTWIDAVSLVNKTAL